ncbi:MAG: potassium-transporting ATPase subunit A [Nitrososphaerota archaeon]|nr:potassium-transporting ATPase subunit A [Nitrososphaerota archaeon]
MIDFEQSLFIIAILGSALAVGKLLAPYIAGIFTKRPSRLDRFLAPVENLIYSATGVDASHAMGWKEYFLSGFFLNLAQMAIAFFVLSFQGALPLNPQGFPGMSWDLALNTVVSFATNTNLQHYSGETTLSYLSQMTAIQFLQFSSAATGICMAAALVRCFISGSKDLGNFFVDFVRTLTRLLIPLCVIAAVVLVALGIPQTLNGYQTVTTLTGATQSILVGPVASLVSIMQLGTNGGGYYGANSAYPFQNPSPVTDVFEIFLMLLLPTALIFAYGELLGKKREYRPILIGAYSLFAIDLAIALIPNTSLGAGIETRFGGFFSAFWTAVTTAVTTGSVNSSLAAMHPLTVVSAFLGMLIQATPGGDGVGLMYMVMFIVITVFVVGLMSGRTPEYLGIKITARDVKLVILAFLVHPIIILVPTLLAFASGAAAQVGASANSIGFTKVLYEFTTAAANNGSDFFGAAANTPFFNIATSIVILLGRYAPMGILLAMGGSMLGRKRSPEVGLRTDSLIFSVVLVGSILVLVVLTFFPFLALGPLLQYFNGQVNSLG